MSARGGHLPGICDQLSEHVAEIVEEWDRLACEEPKLAVLPKENRWDALPDATMGLLNASLCSPTIVDVHRKLVAAALQHGQDRHDAGVSPDVIFHEYGALHDAIWHHLQRIMSAFDRVDAILRIDMAISLATRASLSGYHRAKLEETGAWAGIVDYLIGEGLLFNGGR